MLIENAHSKKVEKIFKDLETSKNGLSEAEAKVRLEKYGENKLKEAKKKSLIARFFAQFKDVMIVLLLVSAVISLVFGVLKNDGFTEFLDAIIIFTIVILNATLGVIQEAKAENAMDALKKMSQPYSKVMRGGKEVFVQTNKLVVGDIVLLEAGDVVPSDMRLIECASLKCDESMLTGESVAIEKNADKILKGNTALGDRVNMCFSSSVVTYGRGMGVVIATGQDAEIGKIAEMLNKEKHEEPTTLQKSLDKFGKIITIVVLAIAVLIFILDLVFTNQHWSESFMTAVAIAVAAIPESLMVVVTIILSIGVTKLAKRNVIIRRLHSVETLGCCEVICSDKTGTITQNKMTVRKVFYNGKEFDLQSVDKTKAETLITNMVLCNDAKIQDGALIGDPTETALLDFANKFGFTKLKLDKAFKRVNEIPFDSNRKMMSTLNMNNDAYVQYIKGGIDELLKLCKKILIDGKVRKITKEDIDNIKKANSSFCGEALRVLGYAYRDAKDKDDIVEKELTFVGLTGMIDPPREEVFEAIKKCKSAGMQAVMITGDHKDTAYAIAKELNMVDNYSQVVDGVFLDRFTDEELKKEIHKYKVFTRVTPEHKVRIVTAFKALGKVVAMTGDGVNDAPSIKAANIGIGMGKTGTEVTKEVADIILTDDNFATIVVAVEEGRKIYSNIQKTVQFLLGCNIAEVLSILLITLIYPSLTFLVAVQILFINLITDSLPAIALSMEESESGIMEQRPRNPKENIFKGRIGFNLVYQGVVQALIIVAVFAYGNNVYGNEIATTMAFLTLNFLQMFHIFNVRIKNSLFKSNPFKNKMIVLSLIVNIVLILLVLYVPLLATIFHLQALNIKQWLIVLGTSLLIIPIVEIVKIFQRVDCKNKD